MVAGGNGLARSEKQVVFVPLTLPGETVRALVRRRHKDYLEADAVEIVEPSPERVPPDCVYFGRCGGCQISHARYEAQVRIKHDILSETLRRSRLEFPAIEIVPGTPFGYRHRAKLKYSARAGLLGFFELNSHRIVDIRQCLCLTPALNVLLHQLRTALAAHPAERVSEIECYENEKHETAAYFDSRIPEPLRNALQGVTTVVTPDALDAAAFTVRFRERGFPMRPDIFLQVNPGLWNPMVQEIESHYENDRDRVLVELYCGAGFFTLPLSRHVKEIHACEDNETAIRYARQFSCVNVRWTCGKAEDFIFPQDATALVVDPPRAGLHRAVVDRILRHPFEKITYVSCDAASLARDLKLLAQRYRIHRLTLLDLFAQTSHFETIGLLVRT